MKTSCVRTILAGLVAATVTAGCQSAARLPAAPAAMPADPVARPELVKQPYNAADVTFITGMVPHHAQALIMAGWAPSHGANPQLQMMCERMLISQRDEIAFMRNWLRDRGQPVPAADAKHMTMEHDGMKHDMLMPGMLNDAEMAALDKARGKEFDRLFLIGMIKHHQGAITMVDELFASAGSMRDDDIYIYAADVFADQTAEIERMQLMLDALGGGRSRP
jgi:uncharacterized protein (DUF305 family)